MVLQTATALLKLPPELTVIGRSYQVRPSADVPSFQGGSLTFQYLGLDVLLSGAPEGSLAVHYWDGLSWTRLETILNQAQNFASAPLPGPGLYALTAGTLSPEISGVSPDAGHSNQAYTLTITGVNFLTPLEVTLLGQAGEQISATVTAVEPQMVTIETPNDLPPDLYGVAITNAGGQVAIETEAFALYTAQPTACFFADFKSGLGKWDISGEWAVVQAGGQEGVTDSPVASYLNAKTGLTRTTTITSPAFSLAGCPQPVLRFRHDYVLNTGPKQSDWGLVEISDDDGQTWRSLTRYTGGGGYAFKRAGVEWETVNWLTNSVNLAASGVPTEATRVRLRFILLVDDTGSDKGWIIDEVSVINDPPPSSLIYLPLLIKK